MVFVLLYPLGGRALLLGSWIVLFLDSQGWGGETRCDTQSSVVGFVLVSEDGRGREGSRWRGGGLVRELFFGGAVAPGRIRCCTTTGCKLTARDTPTRGGESRDLVELTRMRDQKGVALNGNRMLSWSPTTEGAWIKVLCKKFHINSWQYIIYSV